MKLTKLAKNLLAVSALTVASFGANAGAIATSDFTISGFGIYSSPGVILDGITISESDFFGSTVGTGTTQKSIEEIFTNPAEQDFDMGGLGYENFNFAVTDGTNSANVEFTGFHIASGVPVSPTGRTYAHAEATGTTIAGAASILENSATFTYDNDNGIAGETTTATFAYDYILNLMADSTVSYELGMAEAFGNFIVTLSGGGAFQTVFDFNVTDQDLTNVASSGSNSESITLKEGQRYSLKVVQTSDVDVRSVAEPTAIAMLGLGLLGFAGVSRRRKS
jgi:hypothetical protein